MKYGYQNVLVKTKTQFKSGGNAEVKLLNCLKVLFSIRVASRD